VTFLTRYETGASLIPLWRIFLFWFTAIVIRQFGIFYAKRFTYEVAEHVYINAQMEGIRHLSMLDITWHERENTGNKLKRLMNGGQGMNRILRIWINNVIEISVNFVGMIFILANFDLSIGTLAIFYLLSHLLISYFFNQKIGPAAHEVNAKEEAFHGLMFEVLNNIRTVKVLAMTRAILSRISLWTGELYEKLKSRIFWFNASGSFLVVWSNLFRLVGFVIIVQGILKGYYEVGFLILFNGYFGKIWESVSELSEVSQDIVVSKQSITRMKEILNEPVRIDNEIGKKMFPKKWNMLSLHNVSFSYGEKKVLSDISFQIRPGEKFGIVGLSGAGKSTLFKLLLKEHEGFLGEILFDTVPLQSIKKSDFLQNAAVVLQDTEVFNLSLRENIVLANYSRRKDEPLLKKALRTAHIDDLIADLPQGLDTLIGEKGVKLSGGQKQRLGIARAVFKDPQILFLDEATSHLDLASEEQIKQALHEFFRDITAVVIAHRLTTIREMDTIVVLEAGRVFEKGSFEELHAKRGRFFELWEKQRL
jgi:ABC-type multidrug transport system fused ATPase/permease subunit